jgi:hypothetical protein
MHKRFNTRAAAAMQLSPSQHIPEKLRLSPLQGTRDSEIPEFEGADPGVSKYASRLTGAGDAADSTRRVAAIVEGVNVSEAAIGVSATT